MKSNKSGDDKSDSDSSGDTSDEEMESFAYREKFNILTYQAKIKEQSAILSSHQKGRRGIGNYDTFCKCFGQI